MEKVEGIASKINKHKPIKMSDDTESKIEGWQVKNSGKDYGILFHTVIKNNQQDLPPRRGALWMP